MAAESPIPEDLLSREAEDIASRYRVSIEEAEAALSEAFAAAPDLARRVRERHAQEDVTRWRDYREVIKKCRKDMYYGLRRYYRAPASAERLVEEFEREVEASARPERIEELRRELLAAHTSTRERLEHYAEFYERFFELVGAPSTLLDVGCGMHPLSYPFAGHGERTELYVALDRDMRAMRALGAYARLVGPGRLVPLYASLADGAWVERLPCPAPLGTAAKPHPGSGRLQGRAAVSGSIGDVMLPHRLLRPPCITTLRSASGQRSGFCNSAFDLAVMLKVVPVLSRLDRAAVEGLGAVPARRLLLTGSAESMTRRQRIEARERGVLKRFIEQSGRRIVGEFRAGNEFGYLVE